MESDFLFNRYESVNERFKKLAGINSDEAEEWSYIIEDSIYEISDMLKSDCDFEENCHRLAAVTAALAFYKYRCVLSARGETSSFKAGDVSLSIDASSVDNAYRMYREELEGIGDILKANNFVFGRTESLCTEN